jgi:DnaD/phage-associated family protein
MSNYRQLHTRMWADTWFIELKTEQKLLFVYLFSNERASVCGLYEIPLRFISFETGLEKDQIVEAFEVFTQAGKIEYDYAAGVIWVKNMAKYQTSTSPKLQARIKADIKAVPECAIKNRYLYGTDTVSVPHDDGNDTSYSVPIPIPVTVPSQGEGTGGETTPNIYAVYEQNIGVLVPRVADTLKEAEQTYPKGWVEEAIHLAAENNKRSWSYAEAILKRWAREGKDDGRKKTSAPLPTPTPDRRALTERLLANVTR